MGLQSHIEDTLVRSGLRARGTFYIDVTKSPPIAKFTQNADRERAYNILKASGGFNPKKAGKYIIKFSDMPKRKRR